MTQQTETLNIEGMSCNHCVSSVNNALASTEGVEVKKVEIGKAEVAYDPAKVTHQDLVTAIEDIGYSVID